MSTKKAGQLHIARLRLANVLGVEDSVIDLDTITELAGGNARGKSTHLSAIRACLGIDRTSLARLVRLEDGQPVEGKPEVEVLLVGDDCEARVTRKGDGSPEVKLRIGETWTVPPRPGDWLRDLIGSGANPARWLAMPDEEKATEVLAAMRLPNYSRAAALSAAGLPDFRLPAIPDGLHPLEDLELVEAAIFSSRTQVNAEERREKDAATKLLAGLPAAAPADVAEELGAIEASAQAMASELAAKEVAVLAEERRVRQETEATHDAGAEKIKADFKGKSAKLRAEHQAQAAAIRAEAECRIADLAVETEGQVGVMRSADEAALDVIGATFAQAQDSARLNREGIVATLAKSAESLAQARERIASLRERHTNNQADRRLRETAAEAQAQAARHAEQSDKLTAGLNGLKRYRLELASALPISGLAVKFDEKGKKSLTLDGVPLSQINGARRATLAVEVSLLGASVPEDGRPSLPLVLLDDAEKLDDETRAALYREVASRGSQIIAAVVSKGPFRVLTQK